MFKQIECISRSLVVLALLAEPAWAQFEVSPDHFESDQDSKTASTHETELQIQISDLQDQIGSYMANIQAKSEMVEEARQAAISAGIQGDGAGSYIESYRLHQKQLELLQQSMTAQIELARNIIANLEARLALVAANPHAPKRLYHRKQHAKLSKQQRSESVAILGMLWIPGTACTG
jgi:hypothetical protein